MDRQCSWRASGFRFPWTIRVPSLGEPAQVFGAVGPRPVKAPAPGRLVRVLVAVGDLVQEQHGLIVMEAMKMQTELKSPMEGRVARISAEIGGTVAPGEVPVVIEYCLLTQGNFFAEAAINQVYNPCNLPRNYLSSVRFIMPELATAVAEVPMLNPAQRIVNTFIAPSKTFEDVRRSSGWWVPFLVAAVIGILYAFVLLHKVGVATLVDGVLRQSPTLEARIASATPEDAAKIRSGMETQFKFSYAAPVFSLLGGLLSAGILMATANFGAGGRATFKQMLGVWFYATLPLSLFGLLVIGAVYGGVAGDSFNIKNPIGTNVGFYLTEADLPKMLMPILSALDLFAIWTAVLLTLGVSTVAGIKRGAAAVVVFGWWIVFILLQTAGAAFS